MEEYNNTLDEFFMDLFTIKRYNKSLLRLAENPMLSFYNVMDPSGKNNNKISDNTVNKILKRVTSLISEMQIQIALFNRIINENNYQTYNYFLNQVLSETNKELNNNYSVFDLYDFACMVSSNDVTGNSEPSIYKLPHNINESNGITKKVSYLVNKCVASNLRIDQVTDDDINIISEAIYRYIFNNVPDRVGYFKDAQLTDALIQEMNAGEREIDYTEVLEYDKIQLRENYRINDKPVRVITNTYEVLSKQPKDFIPINKLESYALVNIVTHHYKRFLDSARILNVDTYHFFDDSYQTKISPILKNQTKTIEKLEMLKLFVNTQLNNPTLNYYEVLNIIKEGYGEDMCFFDPQELVAMATSVQLNHTLMNVIPDKYTELDSLLYLDKKTLLNIRFALRNGTFAYDLNKNICFGRLHTDTKFVTAFREIPPHLIIRKLSQFWEHDINTFFGYPISDEYPLNIQVIDNLKPRDKTKLNTTPENSEDPSESGED